MQVLLSPHFATDKFTKDIAFETVEAYNEINFDNDISDSVNQCIDKTTYDKISKVFLRSKNFAKNINPQVAFNFLSSERLKIFDDPSIGSFVYVSEKSELDIYLPNRKKHLGVILDIFYGNKTVVQVAPITYNLEKASDKSLILENQEPGNVSYAIQLEFSFLCFIESVELTSAKQLNKKTVKKINNFKTTNNPDFAEFRTGIPNFNYIDYRIPERNIAALNFATMSIDAQEFLENEFVEVAKEEIDSYFATSNMFEKIFIPQNMKFKSTTSIKSEKVFNNIEILRDAAYA